MKTELTENQVGFYLKLEPESVEDFSMLLRLSTKTKKDSISIETSFAAKPYSFICGDWKKSNAVCGSINGRIGHA